MQDIIHFVTEFTLCGLGFEVSKPLLNWLISMVVSFPEHILYKNNILPELEMFFEFPEDNLIVSRRSTPC